jgi:hypothetical protein
MQRSVRRSIYALVVCVLVTGRGVRSQKAKQIKDHDIRIIDLRSKWKQLTKRKSDLQAERKRAFCKETPGRSGRLEGTISTSRCGINAERLGAGSR